MRAIAALFVDRRGDFDYRTRLSSKEASATPVAFRDALIAMARSVQSAPHITTAATSHDDTGTT